MGIPANAEGIHLIVHVVSPKVSGTIAPINYAFISIYTSIEVHDVRRTPSKIVIAADKWDFWRLSRWSWRAPPPSQGEGVETE